MWPAIIAMIASAALQQHSQTQANKRQSRQAVMAQHRQLTAQNEATDAAARRAAQFDPTARAENQQQIQQQLTDTYTREATQPQISAQGVQIGSTIPDAQGTTDYLTTKAKEQAKAAASMRALAGLMGRIGSAGELRRGEAVGIGDTAGEIGRIQTGAGNIFGADQVGIEAAGQPNPGLMFASAALRAYGAGTAGGARGTAGAAKYPEYGKPSGPTGGWV